MNAWICPKCGRVYGPLVMDCRACNLPLESKPTTNPRPPYKGDA